MSDSLDAESSVEVCSLSIQQEVFRIVEEIITSLKY